MSEFECDYILCREFINKILESASAYIYDKSHYWVKHYISVFEY